MTPLNPAFETICYKTLFSLGNFSITEYAANVNVSLISSTLTAYPGDWDIQSQTVTEELFYYFQGSNGADQKVPRTVPLIYRPQAAGALTASMALPTSDFPNPEYAPKPTYYDVAEPFPAIRIAALAFTTPAIATDVQYSFACGELLTLLAVQGVAPVAGPWSQAWVTYSARADKKHLNACWAQVPAA